MKKRLFSLLILSALLLSLLPAAALAEGNMIVNLGTVRAGSAMDLQMGTTTGGTAELTGGTLPSGCSIVTEDRGGQSAHYLRGTPSLAGSYEFSLTVTEAVTPEPAPAEEGEGGGEGEDQIAPAEPQTVVVATLSCSLQVLPAVPSVTVQDAECFIAEDLVLEVSASTVDGGTLSYQWYASTVRDNNNGRLLEGETGRQLHADTEFPGVSYYYCVVTNSNNGLTETQISSPITVTVNEPTITSVSIASLPDKLEYTEGDTLDAKGLTLLIRYSNGVSVTDDEGFTLDPEKLDKPGTQTITVTYQNNTVTFPVIVNEAKEEVEGIAVKTLPLKRDYNRGDTLSTEGLEIEVITNKGNRSTVSTGFSVSPTRLDSAGLQTVTVTYQGKTTSFTVTVNAGSKTVQKIEVESLPTKLSYKVGDTFDPSGMVLKVTTDQGDERVSSGFSCSPSRLTREGTQTITISYGGQTCTMDLVVSPAPEQPAEETPAPSETQKIDHHEEEAPDDRNAQRAATSSSVLTVAILIAAIIALSALAAYIYFTRKDQLLALWEKLKKLTKK